MTKEEAEVEVARYATRPQKIDNGAGRWDYLQVDLLRDGERIGGYRRNYSTLFDTSVPFVHRDENGNYHVFAVYSPHYTATRVMRLPTCEDIGGEEPGGSGFCPTAFLVPYDPAKGLMGQFGFVSGCVWSDDFRWKIQYLELSNATSGALLRDERFGYLELPPKTTLREAVSFALYNGSDEDGEIEFTVSRVYQLKKKQFQINADGSYND